MGTTFATSSVFNPVCHKCGMPIDYYRREAKLPVDKCKSCRSKRWDIRTFGNPHEFRVVEFELVVTVPFGEDIRYVGHYCDVANGKNTMSILKSLLPQYTLSNNELASLYTEQLRNLFQNGGISEYAGHHSLSGRCAASLTISVELWDNKIGEPPEPGFVKVVK